MQISFLKPQNHKFGSGPTRKIKKESFQFFEDAFLGISHRGTQGIKRITYLLELMKKTLQIPDTHKIALVSGSGTGAMEFLIWNLLGPLPLDVFSTGVFGNHWLYDVTHELKLNNVHIFQSAIGEGSDFSLHNPNHDCVFVWNETPSGTVIAHTNWIADDRKALTLCDLTSAVFCTKIPWEKLDAASFSWQKGIGGEAGIGTIVLGPRALTRLELYTPQWPMPRLFRIPFSIENNIKSIDNLFFKGHTLNTISLLTLEDMIFSLEWARDRGGLDRLIHRVHNNYNIVENWVSKIPWIDFLVKDRAIRAQHSVCFVLQNPQTKKQAEWPFLQKMALFLEENRIAVDILNHKQSVPSLRIWLGPVVEEVDIQYLLPWIEIAYERLK